MIDSCGSVNASPSLATTKPYRHASVPVHNVFVIYHIMLRLQGAVSLTYLSILKEGFTPIFPKSLGKRRPSITFHIA